MSRFTIPGLNDAQRAEMINAPVLLVGGCADDVAERIATLRAQCWGHDRGGCGS